MNGVIADTRRRVTAAECNAFKVPSPALLAAAGPPQPASSRRSPPRASDRREQGAGGSTTQKRFHHAVTGAAMSLDESIARDVIALLGGRAAY